MKRILLLGPLFGLLLACSMAGAWHSIAPPGECDACHSLAIGHDWSLVYRAVQLNDETGHLAWQRPQVLLPDASSGQRIKLREQPCFHCHRSPDQKHLERRGRFRHR